MVVVVAIPQTSKRQFLAAVARAFGCTNAKQTDIPGRATHVVVDEDDCPGALTGTYYKKIVLRSSWLFQSYERKQLLPLEEFLVQHFEKYFYPSHQATGEIGFASKTHCCLFNFL